MEATPEPTYTFWDLLWGAITSAVTTIVNIVVTAVEIVATIITGYEGEFLRGKFDLNLAPPNEDESPWGPAYLLLKYPQDGSGPPARARASAVATAAPGSSDDDDGGFSGSIAAYCVDCGARGTIEYWGSADLSITGGLRKLQVGMQGNLAAGLNLGIQVEGKYTTPKLRRSIIPPVGVPFIKIPGIITVGPQMSLEATLQASVSASGEILAGVSLDVPYFNVMYDLVDKENSRSVGLDDMNIKKYFQIKGKLSAEATLGLPISLGIGVEIPLLEANFAAKLINTPAITAEASYQHDIASGGNVPKPDDDEDKCSGIEWGIKFSNTLAFNLLDIYEKELLAWKPPPFVKGCINFTSDTATIGNASSDKYSNSISTPTFDFATNATTGASLVDTSNSLFLVSALDHNLYVQKSPEGATFFQNSTTTSNTWLVDQRKKKYKDEPVLLTDERNQAMFLFPSLLQRFGVSRVRMAGVDRIPAGSRMTALAAGDLDNKSDTPSAYFFSAPAGIQFEDGPRVLLPAVCEVEDAMGHRLPKVFVVMHPVDGLKTLMENEYMPRVVTGGTARNCSILALKLARQL
ncbi:hypothetical protein BDZ85DRAFT_262819 [Elsinoe ampelina]|uniref:DUF7223 domain-containing protein n=1 Tax=Elsinoe ampelina TaxID=302913 RepID=A0A6A6GBM4_9PEZI|nr:hypothetical protein BDZ85DRAFT_262819 [Elsinoe ampelina]